MTKQEIQALIDAKIAGQGSAVDVGGALPKILSEILNAAFAGANVQSDWDENDNTDPSFIKNKPTIPAAQVQSDWDEVDNTKPDFIKNKPQVIFDSIPNNGIDVDSIYAYNDILRIKVGNEWYIRTDALYEDILTYSSLGASLGVQLTDMGAVFAQYELKNIDNPGKRFGGSGFVVIKCVADPNPSAKTLCIVPFNL